MPELIVLVEEIYKPVPAFTSVSSNFKDLVLKEKIVKKIGAQFLEASTTKIKRNLK